MTSYVYIKSEPNLYTVGFYRPDGTWEPESDHESKDWAAERVHYLNGGSDGASDEVVASTRDYYLQKAREA